MDPITQQTTLASAGGKKDPVYVDDVFSTYLYEGNQSNRSINNGIDLSGEGGLVWIKSRTNTLVHVLTDTERGYNKQLCTNITDGQYTDTNQLSAFNSNGFSLGTTTSVNQNNQDFVSWSFRKAPGFFDVVTWSGSGSATGQVISHALGSTPGFIVIKETSGTAWWACWHRSLGAARIFLNETSAATTSNIQLYFGDGTNYVAPTASSFTVNSNDLNQSGQTYVAYIFAHDDAQFGTDGNESIIKCGSYGLTSGFSNQTIDLGFEPQWLLIKRTDSAKDWQLLDNMRGITDVNTPRLRPNLSNSENTISPGQVFINPTGFTVKETIPDLLEGPSSNYIYMAIRRPNKPPEVATEVFNVISSATPRTAVQRPEKVDMYWFGKTGGFSHNLQVADRLRGFQSTSTNSDDGYTTPTLVTNNGNQERTSGNAIVQQDYSNGPFVTAVSSGSGFINYMFKRAPGFFDVVTFSGTGSNLAVNHNLAAIPELIIHKNRTTSSTYWVVSATPLYSSGEILNLTSSGGSFGGGTSFMTATPTASQIFFSTTSNVINASGSNYITYLFATLPGISKVGSYTGNSGAQTIDCGFTNGARFVLIKQTTANNDWRLFDSVRGIGPGNDPVLSLNSTSAQDPNKNWLEADSSGFKLNTSNDNVNYSGNSYIFLAIA